MERVRAFLRTELFAVGGELQVVPENAAIIEGRVRESSSGGLLIEVDTWRRGDGRLLQGKAATLFLPSAKIDYLLVLDAAS